MYFDTDSIIYEYQKDNYNIPNVKYLGELECGTGNKPIHEFVSICPKSYAYKYADKTEVKFKGFTLNYSNNQFFFESIKSLVDDHTLTLTTSNLDFKKDNKAGSISTQYVDKAASFCYDKRQIINKYQTVAFGYVA